jgi:hypothetical protein
MRIRRLVCSLLQQGYSERAVPAGESFQGPLARRALVEVRNHGRLFGISGVPVQQFAQIRSAGTFG